MSLIDLAQLDGVAKDARDFAQRVTEKASSDQKIEVSRAFAAAQHYDHSDYVDLTGFYDSIRKNTKLDTVLPQQWMTDAMGRLKKAILVNGVTAKYARSNGLSIWGPDKGYFSNYGKEYALTRFDRGTKWGAMLSSLYQNLNLRNIRLKRLE